MINGSYEIKIEKLKRKQLLESNLGSLP